MSFNFQTIDDTPPGGLIQVAGGLICQEDAGLHDDGPGDGDPLQLAPRQLARAVVLAIQQSHQIEHPIHRLAADFRRQSRQHHGQLDILEGGKPADEMKRLENKADIVPAQGGPRLLGQGLGGLVVQPVATRIGAIQKPQHIEQCRLAGAGRPHDRDVLSGVDVQIQAARAARAPVPARRRGRAGADHP